MVVLVTSAALPKKNLLAEGPTRKAVGKPKRVSLETGPYAEAHR
jgi:hypothetical protein